MLRNSLVSEFVLISDVESVNKKTWDVLSDIWPMKKAVQSQCLFRACWPADWQLPWPMEFPHAEKNGFRPSIRVYLSRCSVNIRRAADNADKNIIELVELDWLC